MPQKYSEDDVRLYTGGRVGFNPLNPLRAKSHMDLRIKNQIVFILLISQAASK